MVENKLPLSIPQLSNKSNVSYGFTYQTIEDFVKSGVVSPIVAAHHKARKDSKYELTDVGKMIALAICVDEKLVLGDRTADLRKIFQPVRGTDALTFFVRSVLLNGVNNGLQRYVLEFIRNILQIAEFSTEPNLWKIAQDGGVEARPSEVQGLKKSVIQALYSLEEPDRDTVLQYYKTMTTNHLFTLSMHSHDVVLQNLAKESSRDPDGIYIPFECKKCGYENDHWYNKMEDIIVKVFTGGWQCPKCNKLISDFQTKRKGFRDTKIQLPAK